MDDRFDRIYAYGISAAAGSFECVDCGHRHEHAEPGPLPPCPRYLDSTHARAAWRHRRDRADQTENRSAPLR